MSREFSGTPHQLVVDTNVIFSALIAYHFLRWHYISML
jgi:predicted nucleic acid-binding protein